MSYVCMTCTGGMKTRYSQSCVWLQNHNTNTPTIFWGDDSKTKRSKQTNKSDSATQDPHPCQKTKKQKKKHRATQVDFYKNSDSCLNRMGPQGCIQLR